MRFSRVSLIVLPLLAGCMSAGTGVVQAAAGHEGARTAWESWRDGNVEAAEAAALDLPESQEREHVLFNCAFARGEYAAALERYAKLTPLYPRLPQLDEPVIDAYVHLNRAGDASAFARERGVAKWMREVLDAHAAMPLRVSLEGTTVLPFVPVPMQGVDFSDSLPGVAAVLNGEDVVAHFDSGGPFLVMSPDRARSLGIRLIEGDRSFAALTVGRSYYGIARSFRMGDALLENVPVTALPQLTGWMDRVYFGTNILERFLATVDYPARRLVLSPRGDTARKERQVASLGAQRVEIPFFLWGDHFMFARGAVGKEKSLNFFIDSGLFFAVADESGRVRRGSCLSSRENCLRWGMKPAEAKKGYFECPLPISLGPAEQATPYIVSQPFGPIAESFGGVRIDGLLSNGFLCGYAWTLDFDRRIYILSRAE
jgi:hypothetical protein